MHKLAIALVAIVSIQGSAFAYRFTFANHTAEQLQLRFNLAADGTDYDVTMAPRGENGQEQEIWFKWIHEGITNWENNRRAGFCWSSIKMRRQMKDKTGKMVWGPWREVDVQYLESKQFTAMKEASDEAAASIANIGLSAGGKETTETGGIAKGISNLVGYSQCKNRHFDIVYTDKSGKKIAVTSLAQ